MKMGIEERYRKWIINFIIIHSVAFANLESNKTGHSHCNMVGFMLFSLFIFNTNVVLHAPMCVSQISCKARQLQTLGMCLDH